MSKSKPTELQFASNINTVAKAIGQLADEGALLPHWQIILDDPHARKNMVMYMKAGCPRIDYKKGTVSDISAPTQHEWFMEEMPERYLSMEEILTVKSIPLELTYLEEQLQVQQDNLPGSLYAFNLSINEYLLLPTGNRTLNLVNLLKVDDSSFVDDKNIVKDFDNIDFVNKEHVMSGKWMAVKISSESFTQKDVIQVPTAKIPHADAGHRLSTAVEVIFTQHVWGLFKNQSYLPDDKIIMTSSVSNAGNIVFLKKATSSERIEIFCVDGNLSEEEVHLAYSRDI